jgi:XFP N-terminal domain
MTPDRNFIYVHLNRIIRKYDLDMINFAGPGHCGPALLANVRLESTWAEAYPNVTQDAVGMKTLFKRFSFPGAAMLRRQRRDRSMKATASLSILDFTAAHPDVAVTVV